MPDRRFPSNSISTLDSEGCPKALSQPSLGRCATKKTDDIGPLAITPQPSHLLRPVVPGNRLFFQRRPRVAADSFQLPTTAAETPFGPQLILIIRARRYLLPGSMKPAHLE